MKAIIEGINRFHIETADKIRPALHRLVTEGQRPKALIITCSDSRIVPDLLASTSPGDLFIVRNVGNVVPIGDDHIDDESVGAAIEYALEVLDVQHIVVMGHADCGAMKHLHTPAPIPLKHVDTWLQMAKPALRKFYVNEQIAKEKSDLPAYDRLSQFNVVTQLEHLTSYGPVRQRLQRGTLQIHGWWFDIANAEVLGYDIQNARFCDFQTLYPEYNLPR